MYIYIVWYELRLSGAHTNTYAFPYQASRMMCARAAPSPIRATISLLFPPDLAPKALGARRAVWLSIYKLYL